MVWALLQRHAWSSTISEHSVAGLGKRLPGNRPNDLSPHSFGVLHISMEKQRLLVHWLWRWQLLKPAFSEQGAVECYNKSIGLHRDCYSNLKQPDTVQAMCKINAAQIFKRNKESQSKSQWNVLYMIKDVFDKMAAVCAEREEAVQMLGLSKS